MVLAYHLLTAIAVMSTGAVFGIDFFCAAVLRSALVHLDDGTLTRIMGHIHYYGDRRLMWPALVGVASTVATAVVSIPVNGPAGVLADVVAALLVAVWLVVFVRVAAPVNRALTAAARGGAPVADSRALQQRWNNVIDLRAALLGCVLLGLHLGVVVG